MIDPSNITNFNRTEAELQEFLLFCIVVAGKNAEQQAKKLDAFLKAGYNQFGVKTPFNLIQKMIKFPIYKNSLGTLLRSVKMGQYSRISEAFIYTSFIKNLKTVTLNELLDVPGIGPKTSRFFLLHSRPNQNIACLDTHILKWMGKIGYTVPKSTPQGIRYKQLENSFLWECHIRKKTPAELDLEIWKEISGRA